MSANAKPFTAPVRPGMLIETLKTPFVMCELVLVFSCFLTAWMMRKAVSRRHSNATAAHVLSVVLVGIGLTSLMGVATHKNALFRAGFVNFDQALDLSNFYKEAITWGRTAGVGCIGLAMLVSVSQSFWRPHYDTVRTRLFSLPLIGVGIAHQILGGYERLPQFYPYFAGPAMATTLSSGGSSLRMQIVFHALWFPFWLSHAAKDLIWISQSFALTCFIIAVLAFCIHSSTRSSGAWLILGGIWGFAGALAEERWKFDSFLAPADVFHLCLSASVVSLGQMVLRAGAMDSVAKPERKFAPPTRVPKPEDVSMDLGNKKNR